MFTLVVCIPSLLKKETRLPMKLNEDMLSRVKLKRKLNYNGYFGYQLVNPTNIRAALEFLKQNKLWFENIMKERHLDGNLTDIQEELQK